MATKRNGRPSGPDRGGSARGGLGGGKRRGEPEPADSDADDQPEPEEAPRTKRGTGKLPKSDSARTRGGDDSARNKRRTSASHGARPGSEPVSPLKKAMFLATPIMLVVFIAIAAAVANKGSEPPKRIINNDNDRVAKASTLRKEAKDLLDQANRLGDGTNEQRRPLYKGARKKLQEASAILDDVREKAGEPGDGKEFPFEGEARLINEMTKVARDGLREVGED